MEENKISVGNEVIRFAVAGIVCAIADFLVTALFLSICKSMPDLWKGIISTSMGFIVGVILNYILSTFWVFKGVENKKETKSVWFIVKFVILSAIAMGLSYGTYEICHTCFLSWWNLNIYNQGLGEILKFQFWGDPEFWLFALSFVLKTLIGLIWNYFTRKFILYKNKNK